MWVLLGPRRKSEEPSHASDYDNRSGHREVESVRVHGAAGQVVVRRQLKRPQVITFLAAGDFELADVTGQFSRARANTFGLM